MANSRLCSIPDCGKPAKGRGWCAAHYHRWTRHGDPFGGTAENGAPMNFIEKTALPYTGNECILWPYARSSGYARIRLDGTTRSVPNIICEKVNGPAPGSQYEAAHSCGNGHLGCITPNHLSWKTPKENNADKLIHGTSNRGERHGMAKRTEEDVLAIFKMKGQMSQADIGSLFNVTRGAIKEIHR